MTLKIIDRDAEKVEAKAQICPICHLRNDVCKCEIPRIRGYGYQSHQQDIPRQN